MGGACCPRADDRLLDAIANPVGIVVAAGASQGKIVGYPGPDNRRDHNGRLIAEPLVRWSETDTVLNSSSSILRSASRHRRACCISFIGIDAMKRNG